MTAPTITGTTANQTTINNIPIQPFTGVVIQDRNGGAPIDTVTIILSSPDFGVQSGALVDPLIPGTYQIIGTAITVTEAIRGRDVHAGAAVALSAVTTGLSLTVGSTGYVGMVEAVPLTTVTDFVGPVAPTISGTIAGQRTTNGAPVHPFSGVTVTDLNPGTSDMMFIALSNLGTTGSLSGPGLAVWPRGLGARSNICNGPSAAPKSGRLQKIRELFRGLFAAIGGSLGSYIPQSAWSYFR